MKEHPIIFSTDMVKAILEGRKTQTRRVIKPQPMTTEMCGDNHDFHSQIINWIGWKYEGREGWFCYRCGVWLHAYDEWSSHGKICPYGQAGDRLWVRETWRADYIFNKTPPCDISRDPDLIDYKVSGYGEPISSIFGKWRPSIHMPRWASRINLEITEVRVERLQEITPDDCIEEGLLTEFHNGDSDGYFLVHADLTGQFKSLWESLNAKRGYGWDTNPWVWVIDFK